MRILRPFDDIYAYYDGRDGVARAGGNWVDDGALSLGVASYAVVSGASALVYDTHVSLDHARFVRAHLEGLGVTDFTVLLSHFHLDHVAGNEVFADCPIWATGKTMRHLERHRTEIEAGTFDGPPAIAPLVLPGRTFDGSTTLAIGDLELEILEFDIHSDDEALVWIADRKILLAGDALEDPITYVAEPARLSVHRGEIDRLERLAPRQILPNHGDPDRIAAGGYGIGLCEATRAYIDALHAIASGERAPDTPLEELLHAHFASGDIISYDAYERVHRQNIEAVRDATSG